MYHVLFPILNVATTRLFWEQSPAYKVASIILDGYNNHATTENYAAYRTSGGGVGYDNWKRLQTYRLVESASAAVRETDRSVQVSLRVGPVWAYADTQAVSYTHLGGDAVHP